MSEAGGASRCLRSYLYQCPRLDVMKAEVLSFNNRPRTTGDTSLNKLGQRYLKFRATKIMLARQEPFSKQARRKRECTPAREHTATSPTCWKHLRPQGKQSQFIHLAIVDDSTLVSVSWLEGLRTEGTLRIREMAELQSTKWLMVSQRQQIRGNQTLKQNKMTLITYPKISTLITC